MQTHKIKPFPVMLFGSKYWKGFLDWLRSSTPSRGFISEADFDLLRVYDHPDEAIEAVRVWHAKQESTGRNTIQR
jgi:predicted Rossmann-fold nucleotide-binding protein